ncbi:MAG: hypothetical protein PHO66_08825 [Eubacteriales bacterium]|nr:hypothetical protein [Eubacteriales bacterium]
MFRRIGRGCGPNYKRWLGIVLVLVGIVLMLVFIPFQFWFVLLGAFCILIGFLLAKY